MRYAFLHKDNSLSGGCGKPAFLITERPVAGTMVVAPEGKVNGEPIICDSCGEPVFLGRILPMENIVEYET